MKIYLDLIFLLNFGFDFLLLMTVKLLLRRNVKLTDLLSGAFIGATSIFFLFIKMNSLTLFLFKIVISILMIIVTFGFRNIRYTARNFLYLYSTSMILGGVLYYLNTEFSYQQEGLVFYHNGLSINVIVLVLTSPIIVYSYIKQGLYLKNNYGNYHEVVLYYHGKKQRMNGFLDTGNHLVDPYQKRPILLVDRKRLIYDINEFQMILVPIDTAGGHSLLPCIKIDKIWIQKFGYRTKFLLGLMDEEIHIDGVDCILSEQIMEESI
ncbi:MAG: hypothetical protein HFG15_01255 [Bacilli bacterium]|nr:hypothetical protein [Bacilli bacterium]